MGIAPYKTFTFGGVSSSAYGVYLTGEGVFNAPERAVEMLSIPGRNGSFALDQGRFNNIEVTYKAGMYDVTDTNFATKVANLRNWLCSKKGYIRLSDDYNPNEYRMAVYKSGLEVDHEGLLNGEFDLVFECKPQRWLTSGETASAVANNGTLTNPTLFESSPLLAVKGYGGIHFNGFGVDIQNVHIGEIVIFENGIRNTNTWTVTLDTQYANTSDSITVESAEFQTGWIVDSGTVSYDCSSSVSGNGSASIQRVGSKNTANFISFDSCTFTYGTAHTETVVGTYNIDTSAYGIVSGTITASLSYNGASNLSFSASISYPSHMTYGVVPKIIIGTITLNSTQSALGNPLYIDLDIGEAYKIENNNVVSCNNAVNLGSQLPTLASGTNTFTYDNTITELKVTPRWWQV